MRRGIVLLWCVLGAAMPVLGEDLEDSRLDEINRKVEEQNQMLAEISLKYNKLDAELKALKVSLEKLRGRERELTDGIRTRQEAREAAVTEITSMNERIGYLENLSLQRVRSLYVYRGGRSMEGVLLNLLQEPQDFQRHALYLKRIQDYDREVLTNLGTLRLARETAKHGLERLIKEQGALQGEVRMQTQQIQIKVQRQEQVVKELKAQKGEIEGVLTTLRAQALRLETVVASLTGGAEREKPERRTPSIDAPANKTETAPFEGEGLKSMKKPLILPVLGRLIQGFGKQRSPEFEEIVMSKGLEFQAAEGGEVKAVAPGKVMFAGRMPGYQTVLILDHGRRSYSLYGRLGSARVLLGEQVDAGAAIAETAAPDARGRNLYLEIRENGHPVDPSLFFGKLTAVAGR